MIIKVYKLTESVWLTLKPNQKFVDVYRPQSIYKKHSSEENYIRIESSDGFAKPQ